MSKRTESIEIRVSPEEKSALQAQSAAQGKTMSGYLRDQITSDGRCDTAQGTTMMKRLLSARTSALALPLLMLPGLYLMAGNTSATASQEAREIFAEIDANGDGVVTAAEYNSAVFGWETEGGEAFEPPAACAEDEIEWEFADDPMNVAVVDSDGDAKITFEELDTSLQRERVETFLHIDHDGDGIVTMAEVMGEARHEEAEEVGVSPACLAALEALEAEPVGEGDDMSPEEFARHFIAAYDVNRDGMLTLKEITQN
ncbi:MAG: EF-hand domain-containing protein [Silicimonas sp.]|nr:EF-hand domain-containing protein [Silicimonas sp.]